MKHKQFLATLFATAIMLCSFLITSAQETNVPDVPGENVILQWNRVLQETQRIPGQQPATVFNTRSFAMMHVAMFDAVNSIDGTYEPYWIEISGFPRASREAAAAQAAHDVLASLYPTRVAAFDAELAISLVGISSTRARLGLELGGRVAASILALRAADGWSTAPPAYILPTTPGNWQPIAPSTAAGFTNYPGVLPFAIGSASRFMLNPPPVLTSTEYALDFNEVRELGSATSTTRTADQTLVARLWAGVNVTNLTNPVFVWNNVARTISIARNNTTAQNARLFALVNITLHDTLQTTFASKFQYGMWRPTTAIRRADEDGNPNTAPDPNWTSLLGNPPYPSYGGNNAAIGTSQSTILALFFGRDDIPFQNTWEGSGGATRSYVGFTAMADEEANSRIYGGIHYRFDNVAGQSAGRNVANYVFQNFLKLRPTDFEKRQ